MGGATGSVHRRDEFETELPEPVLPPDWPPGMARDLALQLAGDRPLSALFAIEQTRYSRALRQGDRQVAELALDRVRVVTSDPSEPSASYLELEAELLPDGREEDLAALGAELEAWGLSPESLSKFERALSLLDGSQAAGEQAPHLTPAERSIVERLAHGQEVIARRARLLLGLGRWRAARRAARAVRAVGPPGPLLAERFSPAAIGHLSPARAGRPAAVVTS